MSQRWQIAAECHVMLFYLKDNYVNKVKVKCFSSLYK